MSRRALSSQLAATAAAGLLALTTTMTSGPAYGAPIDSALAPATSNAPVALMAYGADTAANTANAAATAVADAAANTGYDAFWQALPTWPTPTVGLDIPGVFNGFDNLFGWTFWNYGLGFSIGNDGPLGIQEWAPSNPFFDVVAESMGTTQGEWPGVGSLVGLLTPMGGFTNIESYANWYDPTGTTCLICNTFTLLGPDNTDLFSWTTNIPIGGSQFLRHLGLVHKRAVPDGSGVSHVFEKWIRTGFTAGVKRDGLAVGVGAERHQRPPEQPVRPSARAGP